MLARIQARIDKLRVHLETVDEGSYRRHLQETIELLQEDLRHGEQQQGQSRERMEMVVKGANVGVWYCPLPFDVLIWDAKVKEHFHLPADADVTIDTFFERIHPDDRERTRQSIDVSIRDRKPYDIDYRTVSANGAHVKWIHASGRGFYDAAGNPTRFDGITMDVTQRKLAEERERIAAADAIAAAQVDAKFRTFFDQGTYFAGVMTLDGTVVEANRLSLDMCGYRREEVIGKKFWECPWWSPSPELAEMVREGSMQAAGGTLFRVETPYFVADGTRRMVDLTLAPVTDTDGRVLFVAPTGIDITEKKRLEDERENLLASERAARDQAEHASRAKDQFLAVLSHELRTPLTPVLMTTEILVAEQGLTTEQREMVQMIRRNVELEARLIDDLLDVTRISHKKLELRTTELDMHEQIRHVIEMCQEDASGKRLAVETNLVAAEHLIEGDPARIQQIVWNLLKNAIKFTPPKGRITVNTLNKAGGRLAVVVRDNGVGIDPDKLSHIFNAFEQGGRDVTRQFGGLGLGLTICKSLVELHRGTIAVESAGKGMGAVFTVDLPVCANGARRK